jgi:N-acetylneuraminic acid mutarotase
MKRTIVLLWSVVIISNFLFAQNTWNQKADYAGGVRTGSAGFSIGNKGYLGVGIDDFQFYHQDFWEWDQSLNVWTQKADFIGIGRTFGVAFSIGNKGYFGMGYTAFGCGCMNDFYEYDPTLNTWVQKADYPGTGRQGAVGFSIGAKGYIGMGRESNTNILKKDFYEWDQATNIWTQKTDFIGTPRFGATGFSIGDRVHGNDGATPQILLRIFINGKTTDSWNAIADFPGPVRYYAASFVIGSNAYVGTGFIATPPYRVVDLYEWDSQNNSWSARADFGGLPRGQAVGFSVGNRGYIGAGDISGTSADFWEYTPQISSTNCQGSQITASLANGLAAWYPFCGNPNDESGNGNDGIVHGASLTSDRFGNTNSAYQFNGISDSIRVADAPELNIRTGQSFSIALWLKQDTLNSAKYFFSKYSGSMGQGPSYAFGTQDVPNPAGGYAYFESPGG